MPRSTGLKSGRFQLIAVWQVFVLSLGFVQRGFSGVESVCLRIAQISSFSLNMQWLSLFISVIYVGSLEK